MNETLVDIIDGVSARERVPGTRLPPLQDTMDVDVIEDFVENADDPALLRFRYLDYVINVYGNGSVNIQPITEPPSPAR